MQRNPIFKSFTLNGEYFDGFQFGCCRRSYRIRTEKEITFHFIDIFIEPPPMMSDEMPSSIKKMLLMCEHIRPVRDRKTFFVAIMRAQQLQSIVFQPYILLLVIFIFVTFDYRGRLKLRS